MYAQLFTRFILDFERPAIPCCIYEKHFIFKFYLENTRCQIGCDFTFGNCSDCSRWSTELNPTKIKIWKDFKCLILAWAEMPYCAGRFDSPPRLCGVKCWHTVEIWGLWMDREQALNGAALIAYICLYFSWHYIVSFHNPSQTDKNRLCYCSPILLNFSPLTIPWI